MPVTPESSKPRRKRKSSKCWIRTPYDPQSVVVARKHLPLVVGISVLTAWRLGRQGAFPKSIALSPGRVAWRRADLEAWLAGRQGAQS